MNIFNPTYMYEVIKKKGPIYFLHTGSKYFGSNLTHLILSPSYVSQLKQLPPKLSISSALEFATRGCNGALTPLQVESEITDLLKYVKDMKPKVLVEIGTANGGTLFSLIKTSSPETIVSIDLPSGGFGGGYAKYKIPLFQAFVTKKQHLHLLRADSHSMETKKKLQKILGQRKIDFLLIDGDHTYQGVKKDFEMYGPLVRKGGSIAFHDIVKHAKDLNCGVDRLWKQLEKKYPHATFVENWNQGFCGIGVIRKTKSTTNHFA